MPPRRKEKSFCLRCKKELLIKNYGKYNEKFCSRKCLWEHSKGDNHPSFKGGRFISWDGYVKILVVGQGKYENEHRVLMEKHLGRKLKKEEHVHHIDGNKQNNLLENLIILGKNEHAQLHGRLKRGVLRPCVTKYTMVNKLPSIVKNGEIISLLPEYRSFIGSSCLRCNTLFWKRKDSKTLYCSAKCGLIESWNSGKYEDRKPKRCPKAL